MTRRECLLRIYGLYDRWTGEFAFACRKGCATCCTRSVTMTTLEGELLTEYLAAHPELPLIPSGMPAGIPAPPTTTNQFAAACLRGEEADDTQPLWDTTPCCFLRDGSCLVYPVRPFMCRSFASRVRCDLTGAAEIEPFLLTLNTVILQCIEHLDHGRPWGNIYAILRSQRKTEPEGKREPGLLIAERIPGFLIPPEEMARMDGFLRQILALLRTVQASAAK